MLLSWMIATGIGSVLFGILYAAVITTGRMFALAMTSLILAWASGLLATGLFWVIIAKAAIRIANQGL